MGNLQKQLYTAKALPEFSWHCPDPPLFLCVIADFHLWTYEHRYLGILRDINTHFGLHSIQSKMVEFNWFIYMFVWIQIVFAFLRMSRELQTISSAINIFQFDNFKIDWHYIYSVYLNIIYKWATIIFLHIFSDYLCVSTMFANMQNVEISVLIQVHRITKQLQLKTENRFNKLKLSWSCSFLPEHTCCVHNIFIARTLRFNNWSWNAYTEL